MREARPDGLHGARVLPLPGRQRDAARDQHARQVAERGQRHGHGGQALVAGRDAQHPAPRGQRARETPQHDGRVVAVGEAVHHARGALGAAVARIGAEARERQPAQRGDLLRGRLHQQPDLPVPGVIAERHRPAVGGADTALRGEHQVLRPAQLARVPPHARVLGHAEDVAAGALAQHLGGERQAALRPRARGLDLPDRRVRGHDLAECHRRSLRRHAVLPVMDLPILVPTLSRFDSSRGHRAPGRHRESASCAPPPLAPEMLPQGACSRSWGSASSISSTPFRSAGSSRPGGLFPSRFGESAVPLDRGPRIP